jgi:hypothetical protein
MDWGTRLSAGYCHRFISPREVLECVCERVCVVCVCGTSSSSPQKHLGPKSTRTVAGGLGGVWEVGSGPVYTCDSDFVGPISGRVSRECVGGAEGWKAEEWSVGGETLWRAAGAHPSPTQITRCRSFSFRCEVRGERSHEQRHACTR